MNPGDVRPLNKLLGTLRDEAFVRLAPRLRRVTLRPKQVLYQANASIDRVYLPETAVLCQLAVMENGASIQTATVGFEGASWISPRIGAPRMPCQTVVVIGGEALTLNVKDLDEELKTNERFRDVLTEYSHALLVHCMRMTGCTGLHSLTQRCATWMLQTLDRVQGVRFSVTHELLAGVLGTGRPTVSVLIRDFRDRGIVATERGSAFWVKEREQLELVACDCYRVIKENYAQVGR